jgi:ubiquitin carboxyl-terminal hydrolase 8
MANNTLHTSPHTRSGSIVSDIYMFFLAYRERSAQSDMASDADGSLNRRSNGSLAERLKQLQGNGMQADALGRKIQRPPSQNFRPQSPPVLVPSRGPTPAPRGPTPGPYTRRASLSFVPPIPPPSPKPNGIPTSYPRSAAPPIAAGSSPRQFVPVSSFGPPSPTHSAGSSPEEDDIQIPRVHDHPVRSPSDFSRTFPPIDELNEEKSMFPSVPTHSPGSKPMTSTPNGANGHAPNGLPWKKFTSAALNMEPRPASTPIPIKRLSGGSRPTTPAHFVGSPGGSGYPSQNSPRGNGFVVTEQTPPRLDLPLANSITPQKLNSILESGGVNILMLDVRHREQFDKERINHDAIVCLEPTVLMRPGYATSFQC